MNKKQNCTALLSDGEPCQAPAQAVKNLCFWHDPDQVEARITASQDGGLHRRRQPAEIPTADKLDPEEARALLARVIEATITVALDPGMARLVQDLLQIEAKIRAEHDLKKELRR